MKLIMDRREAKEGFIMKSTVYYLDITLEMTPEEMEIIKRHKWEKKPMCEAMFKSGVVLERSLGELAGKSSQWPFKTAEHLAHAESQIIENAKLLKEQLEVAAEFTSGGPREIEL